MNKSIITGVFGFILGAAGGSAVTYYIVNEKRDEEMMEYSDHCEERIRRLKKKNKELEEISEPVEPQIEEGDNENDKINQNKGVKKYHHSDGISSKYGENHIFETKEKPKVNKKLINEIDEEEFMNNENDYSKEVIDILLGDDQDIVGFWGYGTDNETFVDQKFNTSLKDLIGDTYYDYDYLLNLADEEDGIGNLYIRNNSLMTEFELIIHDLREEDKK